MTTGYEVLLENAETRYHDEIESIAKDLREKHLIPMCRKYGLHFVSGMGTWFFDIVGEDRKGSDRSIGSIGEAREVLIGVEDDLSKTIEALSLPLVSRHELGLSVDEYRGDVCSHSNREPRSGALTTQICKDCGRKEYITKVALRFSEDEIVSQPDPWRHNDLIREYCRTHDVDRVPSHDQGFVSNFGRWFRRAPAAVIAFEAGQIEEPKQRLYSEDLW